MTVEIQGWLYIQDEAAYLSLWGDAIRIRRTGSSKTVPLQALAGIVCFGSPVISPYLLMRCAKDGRSVVLLQRSGRFGARVEGPCHGNVLLRQAQYRAADDRVVSLEIARAIVAGKVQASRRVLQRAAREGSGQGRAAELDQASDQLADLLPSIQAGGDIDELRGYEGAAAAAYFGVFGKMLPSSWRFDRRQRRPARDPVNALLGFAYALVRNEVVNALETTGLDPQVGYLHEVRPGRPALALDLMEELRAPVADRLVLTLFNRRQLSIEDFTEEPGGSWLLTDRAREVVLGEYRTRMQAEIRHHVLGQELPWRLVAHAQSRLLARHLRGDLPGYLPFVAR